MIVQKKSVPLQAWQLGAHSVKEDEQIKAGSIRLRPDGKYEVFSMEATGESGQIALAGDYFKLSRSGMPYPNERAWFEQNHTHLQDDWYIQKTSPRRAWTMDEPVDETIQFLFSHDLLKTNPADEAHYFSAPLWGTIETAAKDAIIIIHEVEKNDQNEIIAVTFNFVARSDFDETYDVISYS